VLVAVSPEVRWPAHGVRRVDGEAGDNQPVTSLRIAGSPQPLTRPAPLVLIRRTTPWPLTLERIDLDEWAQDQRILRPA